MVTTAWIFCFFFLPETLAINSESNSDLFWMKPVGYDGWYCSAYGTNTMHWGKSEFSPDLMHVQITVVSPPVSLPQYTKWCLMWHQWVWSWNLSCSHNPQFGFCYSASAHVQVKQISRTYSYVARLISWALGEIPFLLGWQWSSDYCWHFYSLRHSPVPLLLSNVHRCLSSPLTLACPLLFPGITPSLLHFR